MKTEHEFVKPEEIIPTDSKMQLNNTKTERMETSESRRKSESPNKTSTTDESKKTKRFDIDCRECQTYIKYLGGRLTDEQIEEHLRKCTNHKKPINDILTPDGFWDPIIKPFASDDPRNATIIDKPLVENKI